MMLTCAGLHLLRNHFVHLLNFNDENENRCSEGDLNESEILFPLSTPVLGQIPKAIRDFSSQYGSNRSDSYVVSNICSKSEIFPAYGDSKHALVFRTYGPWWINMPSYQETIKHFPRWEYHFTSRDFIDIQFDTFVSECLSLHIYETYNPGALEVVYAGEEDEHGNVIWHRVWTFPQSFSIILENNEEILITNGHQTIRDLFPEHVQTNPTTLQIQHSKSDLEQVAKIHTYRTHPPAARVPRIVKISLENQVSFPTRLIRLEFDHSTVNYYCEIDTVMLYGKSCSTISEINEEEKDDETPASIMNDQFSVGLTDLPFDILFIICSYLDLRSLIRLASSCRLLHDHCLHPLQFQSLNLQAYWAGITNDSIESFFVHHCSQTQYLSLAWTKSIQCSSLNQLLTICSNNLLQLNLSCCQYLTGQHMKILVNSCPNIEILSLDNCISLNNLDFIPLKYLNHVRSLNVYRTKIDYRTLLPFIENNKRTLEYLNLGSCENLCDTIGTLRLLFAHCSNLRSIDLWRIHGLTQNGFLSLIGLPFDIGEEKRRIFNLSKEEQEELALIYTSVNMPMEIRSIEHLQFLAEIDLGWTDPPPGFIKSLVQQIGHSLIKLFLTACRRIINEDIVAVSEHCLQLRQLDLLGSRSLTESTVECILKRCIYLEFLDLSFCDKISSETITLWTCQYKNCFKRSYSPRTTDDIHTEFP